MNWRNSESMPTGGRSICPAAAAGGLLEIASHESVGRIPDVCSMRKSVRHMQKAKSCTYLVMSAAPDRWSTDVYIRGSMTCVGNDAIR
eukprot:scaffold455073_cov17-Prasinocladus_malaysianus.AAC.1